jgi:hypothetical protein
MTECPTAVEIIMGLVTGKLAAAEVLNLVDIVPVGPATRKEVVEASAAVGLVAVVAAGEAIGVTEKEAVETAETVADAVIAGALEVVCEAVLAKVQQLLEVAQENRNLLHPVAMLRQRRGEVDHCIGRSGVLPFVSLWLSQYSPSHFRWVGHW